MHVVVVVHTVLRFARVHLQRPGTAALSPDLQSLVEAGVLTWEQAVQMMPPMLTPDLEKMVKDGDITQEDAARLMAASQPHPEIVSLCGDLVSKDTMPADIAGQILTQIQTKEQLKELRFQEDKVKQENPLLTQSWATRQEAVDAVKYHSTKQGKQVLVNNRLSNGSSRIVLECASKLSTTRDKKCGKHCECNYRAVIRKSKNELLPKRYKLKQGTTVKDLQHSARCTSKGKLTFREAKLNLKTTKMNRVIPTIRKTHERIARDNKVQESFISPYVAARTRLEEAKQANKDYHANWSKLDAWGEELTERNPKSKCHVDVDKQGRFKRQFVGLRSAAWVAANTGRRLSPTSPHPTVPSSACLSVVYRRLPVCLSVFLLSACLSVVYRRYAGLAQHSQQRKRHNLFSGHNTT